MSKKPISYIFCLLVSLTACHESPLPVDPVVPPVTPPNYSTRNWTQLISLPNDEGLPQASSYTFATNAPADQIFTYLKTLDGTQSIQQKWQYSAYSETFGAWRQQTTDELLRINPVEFTLFDLHGAPIFFTGLGHYAHPESPHPNQYLRDFVGIPYDKRGRLPDYPGAEASTVFFVIDQAVYVLEAAGRNFLWFYNDDDDPAKGFRSRARFPLQNVAQLQTFVIGTKGYVLVEGSTVRLYEYNPSTDKWTRRADFPGKGRSRGLAWGLTGRGYYGLGQPTTGSGGLRDLWQYNPETDTWTSAGDYPGAGNVDLIVQVVKGRAYLGLGYQATATSIGTNEYTARYDWWNYSPD